MRALAVTPGQARTACLLDVPEPGPEMGSLLVQTLPLGWWLGVGSRRTDRSALLRVESAIGPGDGAGPIGLLAALMGRQRGLEVRVFDQVVDGPKPQLAQDLGALITRRVPLADWQDALERRPHGIKVIIEFGAHA